MEKKTYKDYMRIDEKWYIQKMKLLDKKIASYDNWFMSNTKWKKLFLTIFENTNVIKQCEIVVFRLENFNWINNVNLNIKLDEVDKYLYDDYIDVCLSGGHDTLCYREIEYLEFRKYNYEWIGSAVLKKEELQNTSFIKEVISKIGLFHWEETEEYIRIYGYK